MTTDLTPDLVGEALRGVVDAQRLLLAGLTPEIHFNVAKMLRRWRAGSAAARNLRQEVEDMVQEVFLELFADDGKVLRRWDPARLPLVAFVGYVARIRTAQVMRSRRSPWREEPRAAEDLDTLARAGSPERVALSQDELDRVYLCLAAGFGPEEHQLFELLFVRETAPQEAAERVGKSLDAVYKWRSRLYRRARDCRQDLSERRPEPQRSA